MRKIAIMLLIGLVVLTGLVSAARVNFISNCQTINVPGYYVLLNNLNSSGSCFHLNANNINLDLNGKIISGVGNYEAIISNANHITVRNGIVNGFETGVLLNGVSFNIIENNIINSPDEEGILLVGGSNNSIRNNIVMNSDRLGLSLENTLSNSITNNLIRNSTYYDLYITFNSTTYCNNLLLDNIGSNGHPIILINNKTKLSNLDISELVLCNADNSKINKVNIDNGKYLNNGIILFETDNAFLNDVSVTNSSKGLFMIFAKNNLILNSRFINNRRNGIEILESNWNNIIASTVNNNRVALELSNARNNIIHSNYIMWNLGGISMDDSQDLGGNMFYNNLFNNTYNIDDIDDEGWNAWNVTIRPGINIVGGSFIGGNYWATPNRTGYSQNCTDINSDGFCDQPLTLAINNTDYLPLKI